jgi:hypothetical protein
MQLDIIKVFFMYQLMHKRSALKRIIKFTLKQLTVTLASSNMHSLMMVIAPKYVAAVLM